jgi:hypothetical protein
VTTCFRETVSIKLLSLHSITQIIHLMAIGSLSGIPKIPKIFAFALRFHFTFFFSPQNISCHSYTLFPLYITGLEVFMFLNSFISINFFLGALGFELRASCLLGWCCHLSHSASLLFLLIFIVKHFYFFKLEIC